MDLYRISYVEEEYPYGLHWKKCVELVKCADLEGKVDGKTTKGTNGKDEDTKVSSSKTHVKSFNNDFPILITHDGGILRKDTTQIMTYIYSRSMFSQFKLYPSSDALDWERYFDENLAPAAQYLYWYAVMEGTGCWKHCFIENLHWRTHRRLLEWTKPLLWIRWNLFSRWKNAKLAGAIDRVGQVLDRVTEHLDRGTRNFISGDKLTAADLTFASHASLLLWPNKYEDYMDHMRVHVPCLDHIQWPELRQTVRHWKSTLAGQQAIRMYRSYRGTYFGTRPSRYDREHNPWWTRSGWISYLPWIVLAILVLVILFLVWELMLMGLGKSLLLGSTCVLVLGCMHAFGRRTYQESYNEFLECVSLYRRHIFGRHL